MTALTQGTDTTWRFGAAWVVTISTLQVLTIMAQVGAPLQPLVSVLFVLSCPGFFIVDMQLPRDPSARLLIGLTSSLAINVVVFTIIAITDAAWAVPIFALVLIAAVVVPGRSAMKTAPPPAVPEAALLTTDLARPVEPQPTKPAPAAAVEEVAGVEEPEEVAVPDPVEPIPPAATQQPHHEPVDAAVAPVLEPDSEPDVADATPAPPGPEPTRAPEPAVATPQHPAEKPAEQPELALDLPAGGAVNVNTAPVEQLETLPGIGPTLAGNIVAYRDEHGPFSSLGELTSVSGIGRGKLTGFLHLVTLEDGSP